MNELILAGATGKRMTSLELADLSGKQHAHVMRDIRDLITQGAIGQSSFGESSYVNVQNKQQPMYTLDFEATMTLVTGYDAKRRAAVIRRWVALESGEATPAYQIPPTYSEALRLAADLSDQVVAQAKQIEAQAPLVEFANTIGKTEGAVHLGDFAKAISGKIGFIVGRNTLFDLLRAWCIIDGKNRPYQKYINAGWFTVRESTYEHPSTNGPRACFTTMITGKGQIAIFQKVADYYQSKQVGAMSRVATNA